MKKRIQRVRVTAKDIREGVPGDAERCPVACALRRAGFDDAAVGATQYVTRRWGFQFYYITPEAVRVFLTRFDNQQPVTPLSFSMMVVRPPRNYKRRGLPRIDVVPYR